MWGTLDTLGTARVHIRVGTTGTPLEHVFVVAAVDAPLVVGLDLLVAKECVLDLKHCTLSLGGVTHVCRALREMPRCL
jgi:hypothetical protein